MVTLAGITNKHGREKVHGKIDLWSLLFTVILSNFVLTGINGLLWLPIHLGWKYHHGHWECQVSSSTRDMLMGCVFCVCEKERAHVSMPNIPDLPRSSEDVVFTDGTEALPSMYVMP